MSQRRQCILRLERPVGYVILARAWDGAPHDAEIEAMGTDLEQDKLWLRVSSEYFRETAPGCPHAVVLPDSEGEVPWPVMWEPE